MKIKRYTGNNAQEAMLKVKMDMGNDAIILHTRNIKQRGWFSLFSKPMVEILAAIDDEYGLRRTSEAKPTPKVQRPNVPVKGPTAADEEYSGQMNEIESKVNRLEAMIRKMYEHTQNNGKSVGTAQKPAVLRSDEASDRVSDAARIAQAAQMAQSAVASQASKTAQTANSPSVYHPSVTAQRAVQTNPGVGTQNPAASVQKAAEHAQGQTVQKVPEPKTLEPFLKNMENNEVDKQLIFEIAKKVKDKFSSLIKGENTEQKGGTQQTEAIRILKQELEEIIGEPRQIKLKENGKPTVAIFLGPTGVGKTTTIAKIAANYALNKNKRVALITSDTYRIAAVDQLKTYAEILSIPVSVVYSADEMKPAIEENDSADLILIDTAGISHKRKQQMEELKTVIQKCGADEVYLVMSATTSWKNCQEVIHNHQFLQDYKFIFTKLDEAPSMGLILNAKYYSGKSLSYVTTGQSVPDDIDLVNVDKLTKNLLRSTAQ